MSAPSIQPRAKDPADIPITQRQREVWALVGRGLQNKEIARVLHLSEATIRTHMRALAVRTKSRNRAEIALKFHGIML